MIQELLCFKYINNIKQKAKIINCINRRLIGGERPKEAVRLIILG